MPKFIFRHRWSRLLGRQGRHRRLDRSAAQGTRHLGRRAQARSLPERRPRHDEPLPARRVLRHRGRRRDRPRPRPLRALHRRQPRPRRRTSPPARSTRRSSAASAGATSSAARSRSSRTSPTRSRTRIRKVGETTKADVVVVRGRRHGRRHREPAVPRVDPPASPRGRHQQRALRPRDLARSTSPRPAS